MFILTNLTCPLKIYVIRSHSLISMNIFFTIKDHSFSLFLDDKGVFYNGSESDECDNDDEN